MQIFIDHICRHIRRHIDAYKLLVIGTTVAAIIGAITSIVYDTMGPHPWDTYAQDQQQLIDAGIESFYGHR